MSITTKPNANLDPNQVLQEAFNQEDKSLTVSGYVTGKVGHKIIREIVSDTVEIYHYLDIVQTFSCDLDGSEVVLTENTGYLSVGMYVFGTDISAYTTIISIDSNTQFTMSAVATNTAIEDLKFANLIYSIQVTYDDASHSNVNEVERVA